MMVLLLLLALQSDARVRELIEQLGSEGIEEREQAADELVKIGAAAVPALKGLTTAAAREVLRRIERAERLKAALPPPRLVTLRWEKKPLRDALAELGGKAGLAFACEDAVAAETVTFACEGRTAWQALAEACRTHGGLSFRDVFVEKKPAGRHPELTVDGVFLRVERAELYSKLEIGGGRSGRTMVDLFAGWDGGRRPWQMSLHVDAFCDDRGTDLRLSQPSHPMRLPLNAMTTWPRVYTNKLPHEDAKSLSLRGRLTFGYVLATEQAVWDAPTKAVATERKAGGLKITLASIYTGSTQRYLQISAAFDERAGVPAGVDFVLRDVKDVETVVPSSFAVSQPGLAHANVLLPDAEIKELRVRIPTDVHAHDVPFEFKDVPIR